GESRPQLWERGCLGRPRHRGRHVMSMVIPQARNCSTPTETVLGPCSIPRPAAGVATEREQAGSEQVDSRWYRHGRYHELHLVIDGLGACLLNPEAVVARGQWRREADGTVAVAQIIEDVGADEERADVRPAEQIAGVGSDRGLRELRTALHGHEREVVDRGEGHQDDRVELEAGADIEGEVIQVARYGGSAERIRSDTGL